jgi:hypothetical protein
VFCWFIHDFFTFAQTSRDFLFSDADVICYSNEFDCRPELEIKAFLKRNEKKKNLQNQGLMRLIWKGKSFWSVGLKICIFMYSRAWLAHPLRWLPLACQENVALPILRPLAHWLMRNTHSRNFGEVCPQWTSLKWKRFPCLPVIQPSSDAIQHVLRAKGFQIRMSCDKMWVSALFIRLNESRNWVLIPLYTEEVSGFYLHFEVQNPIFTFV